MPIKHKYRPVHTKKNWASLFEILAKNSKWMFKFNSHYALKPTVFIVIKNFWGFICLNYFIKGMKKLRLRDILNMTQKSSIWKMMFTWLCLFWKKNLDIDIIKLMKSRGRLVGKDWLHTL